MVDIGRIGYCEPTDFNSGDCSTSAKGSFAWPLVSRYSVTSLLSQEAKELEGMRDCVRECLSCAQCFFVSFSRNERDCSWYKACDLNRLQNAFDFTHHQSRRVRNDDGTIAAEARAFLDGPRARGASGPRPRLVDIVAYGGPHYDPILELRMSELASRVDLFVVVEHERPGLQSARRAARGFNKTSERFLPYAARTAHVRRAAPLDEFVDFEQQPPDQRGAYMGSWVDAHEEVGRPGDVVLVGDIDEIPRAARLEELLRDERVLADLDESVAFALAGPTYYYHLECEARGEHFSEWSKGPRLVSGATLRHYSGHYVRDFAGNGEHGGRLPLKVVANASWHLRYFMAAAEIRAAMCAHSNPLGVIDASEFWAGRLNATRLCHAPSAIKHAIGGCADLWARPTSNMMRAPRDGSLVPLHASTQLAELPKMAAVRRDQYLVERLNRIGELELRRSRRHARHL